ncbi:MAG: hypothetical protein QW814_03340, partial [Methanothrix sp.]
MSTKSMAMLMAFSFVLLSTVSFASGIGTSKITFSAANATIAPGSSGTVSYTVSLVSGGVWGTNTNLVNYANLSKEGINVSLSKTYSDPNYTGTMTIKVSGTTKPGTYAVLLNATGDDPSITNSLFTIFVKTSAVNTTTTIPPTPVPTFLLYNSTTKSVNATNGAKFSLMAMDGKLINVTVPPGTYVKIDNKTLSSYNFTLALYGISNLSAPSAASKDIVAYGFAFLVNGLISPNISFVNATGADRPLITTAQYNDSWTSWTVLGGKQVNTSYIGGKYAFANVWTYNSTLNEIVNSEFFKPVMWVFLIKPSNVTVTSSAPTTVSTAPTTTPTTISTTAPYTSSSNDSGYYAAAIVVIVIIIIVVIAATMR